MYRAYNTVDVSVESSLKDVFIILLPCSCFGVVPFSLDINCAD